MALTLKATNTPTLAIAAAAKAAAPTTTPAGPRIFVPHLPLEVRIPIHPIHVLTPTSLLTVAGAPNENADATKATLKSGLAVPR